VGWAFNFWSCAEIRRARVASSEITPAPVTISAVILAAGQGTRMRSSAPKVLHRVAGRPMLSLVLDAVDSAGVSPESIVVVVGHRADEVAQTVGARATIAIQAEQLGTGDAVLAARDAVGEAATVLVLYGDVPLVEPDTLQALVERHQAADHPAMTLVTARPEYPSGYGRIVRGADGLIRAIVEDAVATPAQHAIPEVNAGIGVFTAGFLWATLPGLPRTADGELRLTDLVAAAVDQGLPVAAVEATHATDVMGVNTRQGLASAESALRERIRKQLMRDGVTLVEPGLVWIDAEAVVAPDVVLWPNTFVLGPSSIGAGSEVGPNVMLRSTRVGRACRIEYSVLDEAEVGDRCTIGPFAHLRQGAVLESEVHVGNFGEIKASRLGSGAHMGHFSYVGDADVGSNANIGAGTVTCNFDGSAKHVTRIGRDAFIGSGTMLVAPVEVGVGARTGAGAVVIRNVEPGVTVVGVPARPVSADGAEKTEGSES
jgi:bifunctional UDP-N-acetylglucosamine pyrophosphorylase / glucosamine-1-phosphate N-acetyltransferase